MRRTVFWCPLIVAAHCEPSLSQPDGIIGYEATRLPALSGHVSTFAADISEYGWVALNSLEAFGRDGLPAVWINGRTYRLPLPDERRASTVLSISPDGRLITGTSRNDQSVRSGSVYWRLGQEAIQYQLPAQNWSCYATDVNNSGITAGLCRDVEDRDHVLRWEDSRITFIDLEETGAVALNTSGTMTGYWTFDGVQVPALWKPDNTFISIAIEDPVNPGRGEDVNDRNQVAVGYSGQFGSASYLWDFGNVTELSRLRGCHAHVRHLNNRGLLAGSIRGLNGDCNDYNFHAAMWWGDPSVQGAILDDLRMERLPDAYRIEFVKGLNDAGQMIVAMYAGTSDYLLTPFSFDLSPPVPGRAGEVNRVQLKGVPPGTRVRLAAGEGDGAQPLPMSGCEGGMLLIRTVQSVLPSKTANGDLMITFEFFVPDSLRGKSVRYQAFDSDGCSVSHTLDHQFE